MQQRWSRRGFLQFAGAAGLSLGQVTGAVAAAGVTGALSGCSSPEPASEGSSPRSVTITHLFGQTVIKEPPSRVVSAGYTEQDDLLAVGVVPIGVTNWFGDQPFAVWPWAQPKLGAAHPVVLNLDNGIQVDKIAALKPDLIVAINAGVDAATYQKLSAIAPTVPQSADDAFFEPWKDQASTIGQAVFAADRMKSLVDDVDRQFAAVAQRNPHWGGKKALLMQGSLFRGTVVATLAGWRTDFLNDMGLVIADSIKPFGTGQRAVIPRDHITAVLDSADVVIWTTESPDAEKALLADPEVAASQATEQNRHIFTTLELAGAIAFSSVLSYPVVADQLPPKIAEILG
ncbi:ABC transporter substrate-binding protein [Mycobacterium spongiae]|uniref:ABC transporter substrate-binding protein n=1 Tax=Mycobacterium spongiae TaxID=886343 RepID=A0A975JUN1_9MYCO|nr:ABC transporter substrate-binding protein [Mycobacterium spongiae]QUR66017.1 ABC transporter substrate-binding protein [Mycobacterium spongiae]